MAYNLSNIPVVIAAGGDGSRIGGGKPDLILNGIRLIDHTLRTAQCWSSHIAIAVRKASQLTLQPDIEMLIDNDEKGGPLSALFSALQYAQRKKANHVLLVPCDMPFLPDDLLERLEQEIGFSQAALARSNGQVYPICALWSTDVIEHIADYAATGRRSLIGFAETMQATFTDWIETEPDPFFNINTPQDLKQAQAFTDQNSIA